MNPNFGFNPAQGGYPSYGTQDTGKRKKLIIFGIIVFVVLAVAGALLLRGGGDPAQEHMVDAAISQNETLRLAGEYSKNLADSTVRHHDAEMQTILGSANVQILAELKRGYGVKAISADAQKLAVNKKSDEALTSATKLNRLDEAYAELMVTQLSAQLKLLQQAQSETNDKQTRSVLAQIASDTSALRDRFSTSTENPSD